MVGGSTGPAIEGCAADEPAHHRRDHDSGQGSGERLNTVVVITVAVVGSSQRQESAVGPEEAGGKARGSYAERCQDAGSHQHNHGNAGKQHAGSIQMFHADPAQMAWNAAGIGAIYTGIARAARDWIIAK